MTTASTNGSSTRTADSRRNGGSHATLRDGGLDELIGGHPEALRALFKAGKATDPAELGPAPRGRLLTLEPTREFHFLVRPIVQALGRGFLPWEGKTFDLDGTGDNLVLGRKTARFTFDTRASEVDGEPALVLRYDDPGHGHPWPLRNVQDELRTIGEGLAIGPALFAAAAGGERKVILWFGLERGR